MSRETVFLLNPPSGIPILRDYYCCTYSKTGYLWHPIDLLAQSGRLAREYRVVVFDAVARRAGAAAVMAALEGSAARAVLSLVGSKSAPGDAELLSDVKKKTGAKIAVSGDLALSGAETLFERWSWLDAVVTDFVSCDLSRFVGGDVESRAGLALRGGTSHGGERSGGEFEYEIPLHDQFVSGRYSMPYARAPFATVLTEFGCPFRCAFCNSGADSLGFRRRKLDNVKDELLHVRDMGVRHIFFKDMTFGTDRARRRALCKFMAANLPGVTWNAYTRADLLDEETIELYASSGCALLQIGVETANPDVAEAMRKRQSAADLKRIFLALKKRGIASGSHYIIGLPGEGAATTLNTIFASLRLGADYASYNYFTPRPGSELYGKIHSTGKNKPLWGFMMRLAYAFFFLRPGYILGRLAAGKSGSVNNWSSFINLARYLAHLPDM